MSPTWEDREAMEEDRLGVHVQEMTTDAWGIFYTLSEAPTKADACDCGHAGLAMTWHLQPCPVATALRGVRAVLERPTS